jgi:hypothetical protein
VDPGAAGDEPAALFENHTHNQEEKNETSTIPTAIPFDFAASLDGYRIGRL